MKFPRTQLCDFPTNNDLNHAIAAYAKSRYDEQKQTTLCRLYMVTEGTHPYFTIDVTTGDP